MSGAVLLISVVFAMIQTLVSWLLLDCEPIAGLMNNVSTIVTTGAIFGVGMALTFAIIFLVGAMGVTKNAAGFVRDHAGRTLALGAMCVIAVLIVSILGEMLYQAKPLPSRKASQETDICFALEFSWSMTYDVDSDAEDSPIVIDIVTENRPSNGVKYAAGETVQYNIKVKNEGNTPVADIRLETLSGTERWTIPSLAAHGSQVFHASYVLTAEDVSDDFYYQVKANYQKSGGGREDVRYALAFLYHAEEAGEVHHQYRMVDHIVTRADNLKEAFAAALRQMSGNQKVSVIVYYNGTHLLSDWVDLTPENRERIIELVNEQAAQYETDFAQLLGAADSQVKKAINSGRPAAVIMLSDGEDEKFSTVAACAPTITGRDVRVNTVLFTKPEDVEEEKATLESIAAETGGKFTASSDRIADLTAAIAEAVDDIQATANENTRIPDTLITERYVSRKTIISAPVLRILILFLIGFFFKIIAVICIGNNKASAAPHVAKALVIGALSACWVEFGYVWGISVLAVIGVYWILLMGQVVTKD